MSKKDCAGWGLTSADPGRRGRGAGGLLTGAAMVGAPDQRDVASRRPSGSAESAAPAGPSGRPQAPQVRQVRSRPTRCRPAAIEDALRFDVTPAWIIRQWPRVSAGLGDLRLQGYRVPLVSGTAEDDLAGALTYYFNSQQQVQRITFSGTTGDPRRLIQWVVGRFAFARRLTNDPGIIFYEAPRPDRRPQSTLCIRPVPVVKASDALARFNVALTIERPRAIGMTGRKQ